ncbi:MAG TPA: DinB family protein, partial [Acidimicrobiales bacterium]|nr:DinB family protein [Acidimicrobiales bacterium]
YRTILEPAGRAGFELVRPSPGVWSAQEYVCHVRDVLLVQRERILLALVEECPSFSRMYRDERVELAGYHEEALSEVLIELGVAIGLFARVSDALSLDQASRRCIYNFPESAERDVAWLCRHTLHEVTHHLLDVKSVVAQVSR